MNNNQGEESEKKTLNLTPEKQKSIVYFISGLGADRRMFQFLRLPEDQPHEYVHWVEPLHVDEPLPAYVKRLSEQVHHPDPILVGLSLGGVAAIEMSKILQPRKTIIISSLSSRYALPWYYHIMGRLRLHRYTPISLLRSLHPLAPYFFGAQTSYEKKLLKEIILSMNEKYLRWSLGQLLMWQQEKILPDLTHIHGTADKVLPLRYRPDIIKIQGGEHLMVMNRAEEISAILNKILKEL
ncbi:alpha/beta hydrolase [Pontibacter silvestris]|uniref:Alpha/beta hydrolase n=1 Tax=Pontibacter silvestris TaxID=2305183 RepID=A0ABW4WSU4_9BACT|nr:alpha/beta hydrolase [Pontibacter silvestris]MCC9138553.1 alpha/beta hydrolase [Pontibacter silvestris]